MDFREDGQSLRSLQPAQLPSQASYTSDSDALSAFPRNAKRRAPITNVACQGCRKRKTKCDGQRPRCANCTKRGVQACQYDPEGTQSNRIAMYKSTIERQESRILELECEIARLRDESPQHQHGESAFQLPIQNLAFGSPLPRLPPIATSSSSETSSKAVSSPLGFELDHARRVFGDQRRQQVAFSYSQSHTEDSMSHLDDEEIHMGQHRRMQDENILLKEIMVLLTFSEDRPQAEEMALRIRDDGLTDALLSEANGLAAAGRTKSHKPQVPVVPYTLPALSTLDLPTLTSTSTLEINNAVL